MADKRKQEQERPKSGPVRAREKLERVSLAPVEFEDAMKALLGARPGEEDDEADD